MKRNNKVKALALTLLVLALFTSCDGTWQLADSSTGTIVNNISVLNNLTYEYTVSTEAEFLSALDSAVPETNTVITIADTIVFTGSGTSVTCSDGSAYDYLIEIPESYNILLNFADDSYYLSLEALADTTSSFKGTDTSDKRTLFYVNGGNLAIDGGIVGGTLSENPLPGAVLVDSGGVFASNAVTFRTYSNSFGSTICVLDGTGYIYATKIYSTNRCLNVNGENASVTLDGGSILSSVATNKTTSASYLGKYGSYCVITTEGQLYSYDAKILGTRGAFSTNGGQTYLYDGTEVYVGTKYVTASENDENMLADQKTWYNQWENGTNSVYYAIYCAGEVNEGACFYIYGGTYESESTYATVYIGNRNLPDDGGAGFSAYTVISGGEFINSSSKTSNGVLYVSAAAVDGDVQYGAGSVSISGGTFSITNSSNGDPVLKIGGNSVITDGTFKTSGTGTVVTVNASSTSGNYTIPAGNLTVSGGVYSANDACCVSSAGITAISGGTFTNNSDSKATIAVTKGTTTITGGTFINSGNGGLSSVSSGTLDDSSNLVTSST